MYSTTTFLQLPQQQGKGMADPPPMQASLGHGAGMLERDMVGMCAGVGNSGGVGGLGLGGASNLHLPHITSNNVYSNCKPQQHEACSFHAPQGPTHETKPPPAGRIECIHIDDNFLANVLAAMNGEIVEWDNNKGDFYVTGDMYGIAPRSGTTNSASTYFTKCRNELMTKELNRTIEAAINDALLSHYGKKSGHKNVFRIIGGLQHGEGMKTSLHTDLCPPEWCPQDCLFGTSTSRHGREYQGLAMVKFGRNCNSQLYVDGFDHDAMKSYSRVCFLLFSKGLEMQRGHRRYALDQGIITFSIIVSPLTDFPSTRSNTSYYYPHSISNQRPIPPTLIPSLRSFFSFIFNLLCLVVC